MIIVKISMGMGNQMFQYAAAKALALEKQTVLKLDISSYEGYKLRKFELQECFNIQDPLATAHEIAQCRYNHPVKKLWNKFFPSRKMRMLALPYEEPRLQRNLLAIHDLIIPAHTRKTYIEPHYYFDDDFYKASPDIYLQGYWMSWRYFAKHENAIRQVFVINPSLIKHLARITYNIQQQNSISIHIRRTDYTTPEVINLKGQVSQDFYSKAINFIEKKVTAPVYYLFSDDIAWVKDHFDMGNRTVVYIDNSINDSAVEDFYLMSQCKHNIITNSTFGWWAAYLNNQSHKIIITPKKWYNNKVYNYKDVCPPEWVQIDA